MIWNKVLRAGEGKRVRFLAELVEEVDVLEPQMQKLSDEELVAKTDEFRGRLSAGETLEDVLLESFAVVREAATRVLNQRHYGVQIMGGAALHFGWVAEMRTGEGKTLVSTLPVYVNALSGKGVHVVTANDYLAARDAETMGRLYTFLGLSVGLVLPGEFEADERRAQYAADITYGTNKEFGFDYLRDNMVTDKNLKVQRGHNYVVVDEVDSILIDEARTPLVISGELKDTISLYYRFSTIARSLKKEVHYDVDEKNKQVAPLEEGIALVEKALDVGNLYEELTNDYVHYLQAALKAKELYVKDRDYVVTNGEVRIVDSFTGRIMDGRRWSDGLHQAVEAKEGVKIKGENQTLASVTLQNYFRLYEKLSGMTGTAESEAAELHSTYGLYVVPVPTHRPMVRKDEGDFIYKDEDSKFDALADDISVRYEAGQPVLVGTVSVEKSEKLSKLLTVRGVPHEVLNAKQHLREAQIISQAGRLHAVTVATNMAGRGVDILLGGNPEGLAVREVLADGLVPGSNEYEQRVGDLEAKFAAECAAKGDVVRSLGGLYVLGTERHESRRIDNQLRGRAGRQGDAGESRFYLSLEDEIMRIFATGAMSWVIGRAIPEGEAIEAKTVTKAIAKAQNTVEKLNAEVRKNVLEYDEVMNEQRKVIYARRDQILDGVSLRDEAITHLAEAVDEIISTFCETDDPLDWDLDGLLPVAHSYWPTTLTVDDLMVCNSTDELYTLFMGDATAHYERHEEQIGEEAMRTVERQVMLRVIDQRWREHLAEMDYLQKGIGWRGMGQKDPLTEWRREGFDMFSAMMDSISRDFVTHVMHANTVIVEPESVSVS